MFNQRISGPTSLLRVFSTQADSEYFNSMIFLVGLSKSNGTVEHVSVVEATEEAVNIANTLDSDIILVRGIDRQPWEKYDVETPFDYANKFIDNVNNQVLDVLAADFINNTYISDMCDTLICCDPDNWSSFLPQSDFTGIPNLVELLNQ